MCLHNGAGKADSSSLQKAKILSLPIQWRQWTFGMAMDAATLHLREGGGEAEAGEFKGGQLEGEAMAVACEQ